MADIKAVDVKCPNCKEDLRHGGFEGPATNQRGDITTNLLNAFELKDQSEHFFCRKRDLEKAKQLLKKHKLSGVNKNKKYYLQVPDPVEGHHLITCEAVRGDDWYKVFYRYCYDINCAANGVILPGDMLCACHFAVPLHMGNHEATAILSGGKYEYSKQKNYVQAVENTVRDMKENANDKCVKLTAEQIKKFHSKMLRKSNAIFKKIKMFMWLISSDGMHYRRNSNIGCYADCRTITQKRALLAEKTKINKGSQSTVDWTIAIANKFEEMGEIGCKHENRNHSLHGCPDSQVVDWDKCRWNELPKEIQGIDAN